jgi:hypothetical protein
MRHRAQLALVLWLALAALMGCAQQTLQDTLPWPAPQNPSPMVEHTRAHERIAERELAGDRWTVPGPLGQPVSVYVPEGACGGGGPCPLLIHFHGSAFLPEYAAHRMRGGMVVAVVQLGAGSGIYDRAFSDPAVFDTLPAAVRRGIERELGRSGGFSELILSGFSAGHGAIRAILREPRHFARVDAVLLLDGLHTGYEPPGAVVAEGGRLDPRPLDSILDFARRAAIGEKRLLITHSEIFPGTFASTTETTDYLIGELDLRRTPVLAWGPVGMQQLSEVRRRGLAILGFAGNSGPDHIDHFHGMDHFLSLLQSM